MMKRFPTPFWTRVELFIDTMPNWAVMVVSGTIFFLACSPLILGAAWMFSWAMGWGDCR